jgi:hypothetical protein
MRFAGIDIGGERHAVAVVDEAGSRPGASPRPGLAHPDWQQESVHAIRTIRESERGGEAGG